jgi:hypothetical protein
VTDPARNDDLPRAVADALETAGVEPKLATLMGIITEFQEMKRKAAAAAAASVEPAGEKLWPLMKLVPVGVRYERARRAAEDGRLEAEQLGDSNRWFCTEAAMDRWLAMIGHSKSK